MKPQPEGSNSPESELPRSQAANIGSISLAIATTGFGALETIHYTWGIQHPIFLVARAGFEAAVIGGVADWFAVRALFHRIPVRGPFTLPHTNLVIGKRKELTQGLRDLVENHLLSPQSVTEKLKTIQASRLVIEHLDSSAGRGKAIGALRSLAGRFAPELEDQQLRKFISNLLKEQVRAAEIAPLVGEWIEYRVEAGDTKRLWMSLGSYLADQAEARAFDPFIRTAITAALESMKDKDVPWYDIKGQAQKLLAGWMVNPQEAAAEVREAISKELRRQSIDADHVLNTKLDKAVLKYARKLCQKVPDATAQFHQWQEALAANIDFDQLVDRMLTDVRAVLEKHLSAPPEELNRSIDGLIARMIQSLKSDLGAQAELNRWAREAAVDLASRYHSEIGDIAEESLGNLSDKALVAQLESQVGKDLQWIRLNGAIVGGIVGVLIAAAHVLLPS